MQPTRTAADSSTALRPEHFPARFAHDHIPLVNPYQIFEEQLTPGQRIADGVAKVVGSWTFIIVQSLILLLWAVLNVIGWAYHWDPYPFILMNLFLSLQAAYTAPMLMMSQNRQAAKDRIEAHNDFLVNQKAENEIRLILDHLEAQNQAMLLLHQEMQSLKSKTSCANG